MEEDQITKELKTKDYTLRATKAYYQRNKLVIRQKVNLKRFGKVIDVYLNKLETLPLSDMEKWVIIYKITSYKEYKTNSEVRCHLRDRLIAVIENLNQTNQDLTFLRLGGKYGDELDISL
jgi:hypothetical protein